MGYGFGGFLLVVGLVLALAVTDSVNGVDLTVVGWIMAIVGALLIVLTAATVGRRGTRAVETTTHRDGSQTVSERRTEI
jgi:membrane protein implicated in regulation of membrane protease activity